jgi:DNA-binding MarR family transcriptional regulator
LTADSPQAPTARLILAALRSFETTLQQRLHDDGFDDVSISQTNLLRHLNSDGMKLHQLAHDAGMSKQGVSQGVRTLQARDLVAVEPDPHDRRAKRVVYTDRGRALIACAIKHVIELEQDWQQHLGLDGYSAVRQQLVEMATLWSPPDDSGEPARTDR